MAPKICDGDIVCIRKQPEAENPTFAPLVYANHQLDEIEIEGKAVGFCRGL